MLVEKKQYINFCLQIISVRREPCNVEIDAKIAVSVPRLFAGLAVIVAGINFEIVFEHLHLFSDKLVCFDWFFWMKIVIC